MSKRTSHGKSTRGKSSSSREPSAEDRVHEFGVFDNDTHQLNYNTLSICPIHSGSVIDWSFLDHGLDRSFFESINTDSFSGPQWINFFQINELVYGELVREFFASIEFESIACRYDHEHLGVTFRLGGEPKELSLLEFGWRVGLYSEEQSKENSTRSGLSRAVTVKAEHLLMEFWPTIGDGEFVVRRTSVKKVRDPRVRLAHRCIATTISSRKEYTQRITTIYLFYLYCIYGEGVVGNIPYWLARNLRDVLSVEPHAHTFKKKSLITMRIIMELDGGACYWPATRGVGEDDEARHGLWMDQKDSRWGQMETWMTRQDQRADWMYDHTTHQFQHLSTRDNLEPHLQIDPFQGREAD
ncbi:hypothetical protein Tco_1089390 [Tanacetum coccineum]